MEIGKPVRVHEVEPEEVDAPRRTPADPPTPSSPSPEEPPEPVPTSPDREVVEESATG